jgi:hypothetical protein
MLGDASLSVRGKQTKARVSSQRASEQLMTQESYRHGALNPQRNPATSSASSRPNPRAILRSRVMA